MVLLASLGAWLVGALVFFRDQWTSGFRHLSGNGGDSAFIVYLLEHWFRALHGQVSWANPPMFYPVKGLLGWSDGLVLFEVLYAPLRWLGADEFLAAQLTLILLSLLGMVTFVVLIRRLFDPPLFVALAGGVVFTFANDLWNQSGHYQLMAIWLVPGIALLVVGAWRADSGPRSLLLGVLAGLLGGLLFFTSFYVAWFCASLSALTALVTIALRPRTFANLLHRDALVGGLRRRWPVLLAAAGGLGVAMIPFLDVYLTAQGKVPSATYQQVIGLYGIGFHGLFDLGPGNVWSSSLRRLSPGLQFAPGQAASEATPVLLVASAVAAGLAFWRSKSSPRAVASAALDITAVITCLLTVRVSGHSAWIVMWHLPGGRALRAVNRIQLLTSAVATTSLVASVTELWTGTRRAVSRGALAALLIVVVVEQVNTTSYSDLDRPATLAFLRSVPAAPPSCQSFYMTTTSTVPVPAYAFQVDAILLSQRLGLATIDGYTGYDPPGWELGRLAPGAEVDDQALHWAAAHRLSGLCRLDLSTMSWSTQPTGSARPAS